MIAFIDAEKSAHGVEPICRVLPIAPSTYHANMAGRADPRRLSARARRDAELRPEGVPLDVIQKLCGYRDPRSTEVYAKPADQALVEAIRRPRIGSAGRSPPSQSLRPMLRHDLPPSSER